jgi:hypothetical protein
MGQNQGSKLHVPAYVTFRFVVVKSVVCDDDDDDDHHHHKCRDIYISRLGNCLICVFIFMLLKEGGLRNRRVLLEYGPSEP